MSKELPLAGTVTELAGNYNLMLEALSALQQLAELRTDTLSEVELLTSALGILHRCCRATTCTAVVTQPGVTCDHTAVVDKEVIAVDSSGVVHMRMPTPIESKFLSGAIRNSTLQQCHDCSELGSQCPHNPFEKVITAVPLFRSGNLAGAISIGHSDTKFTTTCDSNMLKIFAAFLGQLLNCCAMQQQLNSFRQR